MEQIIDQDARTEDREVCLQGEGRMREACLHTVCLTAAIASSTAHVGKEGRTVERVVTEETAVTVERVVTGETVVTGERVVTGETAVTEETVGTPTGNSSGCRDRGRAVQREICQLPTYRGHTV